MSKYDPIEDLSENEVLNTYVSPIDTNKISNNVSQNKLSLFLQDQDGKPLLVIHPDGTVSAESIEDSCLAGKMFVQSIFSHLSQVRENEEPFVNDELLNKTEDLHLLSKIIDAMNNGNDIKKAIGLISSVRKADRKRIENLEKVLGFYADPETYHGCAFMFDRPMPGQKARDILSGDHS